MKTFSYLLAAACTAPLCAALDAYVYTFNGGEAKSKSKPESISPPGARLYFSQQLGLEQYHSIADADEQTLSFLNQAGSGQTPLFSKKDGKQQRMLIFVEGVEKPEAFFDSKYKPELTIKNAPSTASNTELMTDLLNQDRHRRNAHELCSDDSSMDGKIENLIGGFSCSDPLGTCYLKTLTAKKWKDATDEKRLEVLSSPPQFIVNSLYEKRAAISKLDDARGIFQMLHLKTIADKSGTSSPEYTEAVGQIKKALESMLQVPSRSTTIVLMPLPDTGIWKSKSETYGTYDKLLGSSAVNIKRSASNQSPAKRAESSGVPRTTLPKCFSTSDNCISATRNCSSHGECIRLFTEKISDDEEGPECWTCACKPTVVETGGKTKTTFWGGPACQKKDVSVPFLLFAGMGIFFASALAWGIGLLYSIGDEELPKVLSAGVAPVRK